MLQVDDGTTCTDVTGNWRDRVPLHPWGASPAPGAALLLGFDRPFPAGRRVQVWFAAQETPEPACPSHHSVRTAWEAWDGAGWRPLGTGEVTDGTRGFTRSGAVVLAPGEVAPGSAGASGRLAYYVRARLDRGRPDRAPRLLDIAPNAVAAEQARTITAATLGTGTGAPGQRLVLPEAPVSGGTVTLWTVEDGAPLGWRQRPDFDASTRADNDFTVDPTTGVVGFGDGEHGAVVPRGVPVLATYDVTAADAAILPAGAAWSTRGVTNRAAVAGGTAAESPGHAAGRAAETLWAHERLAELGVTLDQLDPSEVLAKIAPERATTPADFERIARDVPGTAVVRARAWAQADPRYPGVLAPGSVTVVVVPELPAGRPEPTAGLLRLVQAALDARRTLCTRVHVTGPQYVRVSVTATVAAMPGTDPAALPAAVTAALDAYFDPLTGGPVRRGWPFGRDVHRAEVLDVIAGVPGVDHVTGLELRAGDGPAGCGNLCLPRFALVAAGSHRIGLG